MAKGDIKLSAKHGVNPSMMLCFYCQEAMGVALLGQLPGDVEAPLAAVFDHEPCDKCREFMQRGVILISVDEEKSAGDTQNPWRTGGWCVVSESFIRRVITTPAVLEHVLRARVAFLPDGAWELLGLPRGEVK